MVLQLGIGFPGHAYIGSLYVLILQSPVHAVTTSLCSYMQLPCYVQKLLFAVVIHYLQLLQFFCSSSAVSPELWEQKCGIADLGLNTLNFYSLHLDQLWVSVICNLLQKEASLIGMNHTHLWLSR